MGVGKERHTLIGQWGYLKGNTPMLLELPWDQWPCASGLLMVTPLERNFCDSPDGTFPVSIPHRGGKREEREGPVSKHQIQPRRGE